MVIYGKGAKTLAKDIWQEAVSSKEDEVFNLRKAIAQSEIVGTSNDNDEEAIQLLARYKIDR